MKVFIRYFTPMGALNIESNNVDFSDDTLVITDANSTSITTRFRS